jgi:hypothetical protein
MGYLSMIFLHFKGETFGFVRFFAKGKRLQRVQKANVERRLLFE